MLDGILPSILIGCMLGFLSGLGTGGGSLLILWLTFVLHMDPSTARTVNLMFFLPCALTASILNLKKGAIPFRKIILPALAGCIAAALFSTIGKNIDTEKLQKLFGVLLIYTGIRELLYRDKKPK